MPAGLGTYGNLVSFSIVSSDWLPGQAGRPEGAPGGAAITAAVALAKAPVPLVRRTATGRVAGLVLVIVC
jgi:hypothetical protein